MSAAALMALAANPRLCPCCWPNQGLEQESENTEIFTQSRGPCPANCMPFVATVDAPNDWLDYDGLSCRGWTVLNDTGAPTYTPVRHASWPTGDWSGVYLTPVMTAPNGTCTYQFGQYCTADEAGNRGRAWVIELWIWDGATMHNLSKKILDWECRCYDATWGADGSRFTWSLTGDIPDCTAGVQCSDCAGLMVDITIPPLGSSPGILWDLDCPSGWNPPATDTVLTCEFGNVGIGCATGSSPQIAVTSLVCTDGVATLTLRIQCGALSTTATYTLAEGCEGTYSITSPSSTFPSTVTVALAP